MACTWRRSGYVGGKNNSDSVLWEFKTIIMQTLGDTLLLGAVTHTTVNGFSHGKFSRGTSHLGF